MDNPDNHNGPQLEENLKWLEADQNDFGVKVLDCRSFAFGMLAVTKSKEIAETFTRLSSSNGRQYIEKKPDNPIVIQCDLSYPFNGKRSEGPLFLAGQMEDKWNIYLYGDILYFVRSWTGELVFTAACEFEATTLKIPEVVAMSDPMSLPPEFRLRQVDYLIKSHLYRRPAPHPVPMGVGPDVQEIAMYSFSTYGRRGLYATFVEVELGIAEAP